MGDLEEAQAIFTKSLRQIVATSSKDGIVFTLEGFARLAIREGDALKGVRLYAAADHMRQKIHNPRPFAEQEDVDKDIATIFNLIDEYTYKAAYAEGQALTREGAVVYALEDEPMTAVN